MRQTSTVYRKMKVDAVMHEDWALLVRFRAFQVRTVLERFLGTLPADGSRFKI